MTRKGKKKGGKRTKVPAKLNYAAPSNNRSSVGSFSSNELHRQVVGLADPWSPHARGSKVPDDDTTKSVAFTATGFTSMATDVNGESILTVDASLKNTFQKASVITLGAVTTWDAATDIADYSAYTEAFDRYRVVSVGVRVYSTLPPTEQGGYFRLMTLPEPPGAGWVFTGGLFEEVVSLPMSTTDIHWISKPIGVAAKEYRGMTTVTQAWDRLAIVVVGAEASKNSAVHVEIIMNCEAQINIGSVTSTMATPAAEPNQLVTRAVGKVHAKHGGVSSGPSIGSTIATFAKHALYEAASTAVPFVGPLLKSLFGGQKSRGGGYPMIVD